MRAWCRMIATVLLVGSASCSGDDAPPSASPEDAGALTCEGLEDQLLRAYASPDALEEAFGAPAGVSVSTEPNRHVQGATDSILVVRYPNLTARYRKPPEADALVTHVEVSDNRYLAHPSVGIGVSVDRVRSVLGTPRSAEGDRLVYDCGVAAEEPTTFWLSDGRVARIEISYYVD